MSSPKEYSKLVGRITGQTNPDVWTDIKFNIVTDGALRDAAIRKAATFSTDGEELTAGRQCVIAGDGKDVATITKTKNGWSINYKDGRKNATAKRRIGERQVKNDAGEVTGKEPHYNRRDDFYQAVKLVADTLVPSLKVVTATQERMSELRSERDKLVAEKTALVVALIDTGKTVDEVAALAGLETSEITVILAAQTAPLDQTYVGIPAASPDSE